MSATPEARQVVGWSQTGFVRRACSDEMNRRNTHVEASPEVPQDAGSIPAASIGQIDFVLKALDRSRRDKNRVVTGPFFFW